MIAKKKRRISREQELAHIMRRARQYNLTALAAPRTIDLFVGDLGESFNNVIRSRAAFWVYQKTKLRIGALVLAARPDLIPTFRRPVRLEFYPRVAAGGRKKFDCSNHMVGAKIIEDWFVACGLLLGDSSEYVLSVFVDTPTPAPDGKQGILTRIIETEATAVPLQAGLEIPEPEEDIPF